MYIITDSRGIIQDIATEKENLSRGKAFKNHKVYEISELVTIGDKFAKGKVIKMPKPVNYEALISEEIEDMNRKEAILRLKNKGKIPPSFKG